MGIRKCLANQRRKSRANEGCGGIAVIVDRFTNRGDNEENKEEGQDETVRREYTKADVKELRAHSKAKTPVAKIVKLTNRT
jgi:hypothetical protein